MIRPRGSLATGSMVGFSGCCRTVAMCCNHLAVSISCFSELRYSTFLRACAFRASCVVIPSCFVIRHSSFPPAVFVDHESHELDECCGKSASRVFVSIRAIRGCQEEPSPAFTTRRDRIAVPTRLRQSPFPRGFTGWQVSLVRRKSRHQAIATIRSNRLTDRNLRR